MSKRWVIPPERSGEFVAGMEDVLEVYHRPYDPKRPQLNLDELHKQLLQETRTPVPARPHYHKRYDYEYERVGTANIFCVTEPLRNRRILKVTGRRTRRDWAEMVRDVVDEHYPEADVIVLVMDNLNTHTIGSLYEAFAPEQAWRIARKLEIHYTPRHGSWLNVAEIELSVLSRQCLGRRIGDRATLEREVATFEATRNASDARVVWRFTTADARIKLHRLYPVTSSVAVH